ncbi:hypothetical protein FQN55_009038 [Onygenales sp. PD_40]|nr:hypothetical protein FQN55_009038 [Onygenales sp. PD_40]
MELVIRTQLQTGISPGPEVRSNVDGSTDTLLLANGPELLESLDSINEGLVGTGADEDAVCTALNGDGTLFSGTARWVIVAKVLNDIVLDERVSGPAIDRKIAVAVGTVDSRVVDHPVRQSQFILSETMMACVSNLIRDLSTLENLELCGEQSPANL